MINNGQNVPEGNFSQKMVGYWFNEKKCQKFGANELALSCKKRGLNFLKVNLEHDLEDMKNFSVILHKFTALMAPALAGDINATETLKKIERLAIVYPKIIIIDPLPSILKLLLRVDTYEMLSHVTNGLGNVFTPKYVVMNAENIENCVELLEEKKVTFPAVCKPLHAGGSKEAHQMALIFNMEQLKLYCSSTSCIVQSFIKHNAVLYKIFVIGERWFVATRPSLKNFYAGDFELILFNSHSVSKLDSCSHLTLVDSDIELPKADLHIFKRIVTRVKEALKSELLGIDIIIDVSSGTNYIIDVNPFPSYDSVPNVMDHIADMMRKRIDEGENFSCIPQFNHSSDLEQKYVLQPLDTFI